jgi:hypothetical protein
MIEEQLGVSLLVLLVFMLIGSLWHAFFIKIATAIVARAAINFGEAFQVAFMIALVTSVVGGGGSYLFTQLSIQMQMPFIDYLGGFIMFLVNVTAGILITSRMVRNDQMKSIGLAKGFLVWLLSYVLWATICCGCGLLHSGI